MRRRCERTDCRAGFTLIEVLLVVAILGILATVVAVNLGGHGERARMRATRASISAISTAIDMYEIDTGRIPASLNNLVSGSGEPNWNGPYLKGGVPADPWGTQFSLEKKGSGQYVVRSAGPDLQMGSSDDITSFTTE